MRNLIVVLSVIAMIAASCGQKTALPTSANLDSNIDSVSFALGVQYGKWLNQAEMNEMEFDAFLAGLNKAYKGEEIEMSETDMNSLIQAYMTDLRKKTTEKLKVEEDNFLAENAKKEGIITTESGLQYEVITETEGAKPGPTDKVKVHYHGTLLNGEVFDSSVERGDPSSFGLNQVIKGWTEGLQLMSVGSKYRFYVPSNLGYGPRGRGGKIKPYTTLIFEVELFEINPVEEKK